MTDPVRHYAYSGENALHLYHLFVNELDSKIVDGYLNIGSFLLRIRDNEKNEFGGYGDKILERIVSYRCQDYITRFADFKISIHIEEGKKPILKIDHNILISDGLFHFPLNNVIVKEQPILCFNKWIEIAVNGMPTLDQVAEFDRFIKIIKEPRDFKFKLDYLQRSAARRQQYTYMKNIESDPYLSRIIRENGLKEYN